MPLEKTINGSQQSSEPGPARHNYDLGGYNDGQARYESGSCLPVGVLTNPRSGGNKKGLNEMRNLLAKWPKVLHREAFTPENMHEALSDFSRNGVKLVVINGGDGTVHAVLTAIGQEEIFAKPPLLALLCAGTTSMLPRDVGVAGTPVAALSRILLWAKSTDESLTVLPRHVLRVQSASRQQPLFGMFFGVGVICQGIKIFHSGVNPMGWRGELMPFLTMLRMLLAILFKDQEKVSPLLARIRINGHLQEERADLFVLISTLKRLFLGIRPYWGEEDEPLHYTAVAAKHKCLLRVLPALLRGRKNRYAKEANGYFSHNVQEVQLEIEGDFTIDGELYDASGGPVTVGPAGPVMFLS